MSRTSRLIRVRSRLLAGALLLGLAWLPNQWSSARDVPLGTPITPAPSECTVTPPSVETLVRIGATAVAPDPNTDTMAVADLTTVQSGIPTDEATTTAVIEVVRLYIACLNALETIRSFAFFTDRYLAETLYAYGPLPGITLSAGQVPAVLPEEAWRSFAVSSVTILPDGRAAAVVNVLFPVSGSGFAAGHVSQVVYVLAQTDGGWRIDQSIVDEKNRPNELVAGSSFVGVVFNVQSAEELVTFFGDTGRYERFWHPTRRDIVALEAALPSFLESQTPALAVRVEREEYIRQYAGAVNNGKRLIIVNAFCDADGTAWIEAPYVVSDGGNCFFSVRYDVETGTFFELRINGEA